MFQESQIWNPMAIENCNLYILCTLILSNPPHLTNGSRLILIQNEFQNVVQIKFFLLVFKIAKRCHQNFSLLCIIIIVTHHFFWIKVTHLYCAFTQKPKGEFATYFFFSNQNFKTCNCKLLLTPKKLINVYVGMPDLMNDVCILRIASLYWKVVNGDLFWQIWGEENIQP
jgi:hypothetical protein